MAERCDLSWLNISFCYKVTPQNIEILISLLRAKATLQTFEAMGIDVSPLALEMVQSTRCLTRLSLCGVPAMTDERVETVRVVKVIGKLLMQARIVETVRVVKVISTPFDASQNSIHKAALNFDLA